MKNFIITSNKYSLVLIFLLGISSAHAQSKDEKMMIEAMKQQEKCWNNVDIKCFMEFYIKSDSLLFMGKNGITYGWENTLNGYHTRYPNKATMGKLNFEIIDMKSLGISHYFMTGKFHLTREIGDISGYFSLVWEKVGEQWLIISDHTSASE